MQGGRTCIRDFIPISINGKSFGRLWHHTDITERKEAEQALRKAKRELEQKVRERTSNLVDMNLNLVKEVDERRRIEARLRSAQMNLRAMVSEVVLADERSREHFATDLHDTVVQTLGAAKLRSQLIQDLIPKESDADIHRIAGNAFGIH